MAQSIIMPKLGLTMTAGRVVDWLVEEGDEVSKGQVIVEIESDKAVMEVEAPADGILGRIVVAKGEEVPVGQVIAWVVAPGEAVPAAEPVAAAEAEIGESAVTALDVAAAAGAESKRALASPRARKLAQEMGVDLSQVVGTGPQGRITGEDVAAFAARKTTVARASPVARKMALDAELDLSRVEGSGRGGRITCKDVERALAMTAPAGEPVVQSPLAGTAALSGVRRTIAERMYASHTATARVTLFTEVDATNLVGWREALKGEAVERATDAPSFNDLLIKIAAVALRQCPYMNASLTDAGIQQWPDIHIGLATDTERGLIVPVVRNADAKSVWGIAEESRELVARARDGTITPDELHGGTFTITNLGTFGVDGFTPIINLPECAILGVGRIAAKPKVCDGQICIRSCATLSLTFDHRVVDGAPAARFLQRLAQLIEQPYRML